MESSSCCGRGWFDGSGARGAASLVSVRAQRRMHRVSHGARFWSATRRPVRAARVYDVGCGLRAPRRGSRSEGLADPLRPQALAQRGGRRAAGVACLVRSMGYGARVKGGCQAVESRRSRRGPWLDAGRADGRLRGPGAPGLGRGSCPGAAKAAFGRSVSRISGSGSDPARPGFPQILERRVEKQTHVE